MLEKIHLQKWIDSVLDPELVNPNVKSKQKRRNDKEFHDRILDRYLQLLEKDSYWGSGFNCPQGESSPLGQLKPDTPFCDRKTAKCLAPDFDQLRWCAERSKYMRLKPLFRAERNHKYQIERRKYEQAKIIWIQRFWQNPSQKTSKIQVEPDTGINKNSRLFQSRNRSTIRASGQSNRTEPSQPFDTRRLSKASKRRKYTEIDYLLPTIWNCSPYSSKQFGCSDSRGIERLIQVVAQYLSFNKAIGFTTATEGGKADA